MTQNTQTETQNASTTNNSKSRRITANMFFKKSLKQEEPSKADETVQRLEEENRKLRQELNDANSRIRELESELESESVTREHKLRQQRETSLLSSAQTFQRSATAPLYTTNTREGAEDRDDDGRGETSTVDDESDDGFSVEVEASTAGFDLEIEDLLEMEETDEIHSTTGSACTIPTGNDKKSNSHRKLRHRSRRRSGGNAHLNYFSRRSPPLESITEINTTRRNGSSSSTRENNNDYCDYGDDMTTTSDLTASVAGDELVSNHHDARKSLMSGRRLPLSAMKSLLRASSAESAQLHEISFVSDDEPFLFGEI